MSKKKDNGLLFQLTGSVGAKADVANGNPIPNFWKDVELIPSERKIETIIRCLPTQLLSFWAPGNIYAQQGSISFFWRSREPLGETPFPLFRVSFADHSSWDAVFIRIDYNGKGIDAFVTDINLSRLRLSHEFPERPSPDSFFHVLFGWDEQYGVQLHIDGKLVREIRATPLLYAGLDQLGTHSRIISNAQVQSSYNYMRTGDFYDIRVYDRMLNSSDAIKLAKEEPLALSSLKPRDISNSKDSQQWLKRWGFQDNYLKNIMRFPAEIVRKVEIHDAWDHKRWWWKACDGIRETTWPGVYNRSRLSGRLDYFVLPDWDCYSVSGKEITFVPLADTYFNQIEISGSASGVVEITDRFSTLYSSFFRNASERSVHKLTEPVKNVEIKFSNEVIEEPIGDISLFMVEPGVIQEPFKKESFYLTSNLSEMDESKFDSIKQFLQGRFLPDECYTLYGSRTLSKVPLAPASKYLPLIHIILPYTNDSSVGMDGVCIHFPKLANSEREIITFNIQIKDPIWVYRNLINYTVSIRQESAKTLFLDNRDRVLPRDGVLYLTIACSSPIVFKYLENVKLEIIYKSVDEAKIEHIADRWIQVKDNYSNLVEENPSSDHFSMFTRFRTDLIDLLSIDPNHRLAQEYWYDKFKDRIPSLKLSPCPDGIPLWAWRQTEYLRILKRFINWWIDKRQIENGEFGGGLSDDGDLTAWWPGPAISGCMPRKIEKSLTTELEAFYDQGMFANGLSAIQTDQLHALEEGIQVLGQSLVLCPTSAKYLERAMENARGLSFITGYTSKGHRHVLSNYYSGTRKAMEAPWRFSASDSFHVFAPAYLLVRYNGSPKAKALILEIAEAMLDHYYDDTLHVLVNTITEEDQVQERTREWPLFYAAWKFSGDRKFLKPINSELYSLPQDRLGIINEKTYQSISRDYGTIMRKALLREYINTEGHLWVDRCVIDIATIQEHRNGGIAHERFSLFPRNVLRWTFEEGKEADVAILVTFISNDIIEFQGYNLTDSKVIAEVSFDDIEAGIWELAYTDSGGNSLYAEECYLWRFDPISILFQASAYTYVKIKKVKEVKESDYWCLPDLAIENEDIIIRDDCVRVRVHNIGAVSSENTRLVLRSPDGTILRESDIPPIPAPTDLYPKVIEIPLWTRGLDLHGCSVEIDPDKKMTEITRKNNIVVLKGLK
ncbi:MAG: hypothetical protein ACOYJ1_08655 [Peptococcales bacterium]|jgi:hypothetical protein